MEKKEKRKRKMKSLFLESNILASDEKRVASLTFYTLTFYTLTFGPAPYTSELRLTKKKGYLDMKRIDRFNHPARKACRAWSEMPSGFDESIHVVMCPKCNEIFLRLSIPEEAKDKQLETGMFKEDKVEDAYLMVYKR